MTMTSVADAQSEQQTPAGLTRSKDVPWWSKEKPQIPEPTRELLEKYSKIPPAEVEKHVMEMREKAWEVFPYPCIGLFRFLSNYLSKSPEFPRLVERLKADGDGSRPPPILLDLGCCFGQEIRSLVFAGVPADRVKGAELRPEFIELGYDLFRDKDTLGVEFLVGDVLAKGGSNVGDAKDELKAPKEKDHPYSSLYGRVSVVLIGAFLHLWDLEGQTDVACKIVQLLRNEIGVTILGRQVGSIVPGELQRETAGKPTMYKHDLRTFGEMWDEVGRRTKTKWAVQGRMVERQEPRDDDPRWLDHDIRILHFEITRVK